ncbi:alpha/beta hydrolase [soil metagenome]
MADPNAAQTAELTSDDGLRIAYHRYGTAQPTADRPLVVLHHGFVADTNLNWKLPGIVDALVADGRAVVGIDARGHGQSEKPHDPALYGETRMAADVLRLATTLDADTYDLVGYSMGAIVSLLVAAQDPRVRRLVIGGVGAGVAELGGVDTRQLPNIALAEALEATDPSSITNPAALAFRQFADGTGADRLALAAQARAVHASPIALDRITAPTLLLVGADDPLAQRPHVLTAAIPDATHQVVAGDHLGALRDPTFTTALVAFLAHP